MNNPPYIIEDVFTEVVAAVATKLARPVFSHYEDIKELNQTLVNYNGSPNFFDKKFPLVLLKQPVTIGPSRLTQIYGEIPELIMFIITGSDKQYTMKERLDKNYVPVVYPILYELKNQMVLHKAFLGYASQLQCQATKYPFWGEAQQSIFTQDVVDVMKVRFTNLKIQNNLNC